MSYAAPEVLNNQGEQQSDLWSVGVIAFILLAGYMPFAGHTDAQKSLAIREGRYSLKRCRWSDISKDALDFVQRLLVVCPDRRLTAQQALEHPWIATRRLDPELPGTTSIDERIADSLVCFTQQSCFRRGCMRLMAWCLSKEERGEVREAFLELDKRHTGSIHAPDLRRVLQERLHLSEDVCARVVEAFLGFDGGAEGKIHYSEFLAAMMTSRLALHDGLLQEAFRRFDVDNSGYLTLSGLHQVLGKTREVDDTFEVVDKDHDGKLSLKDLKSFLYSEDPAWVHTPANMDSKERNHKSIRKHKSCRRAMSKAKSLLLPCSSTKSKRTVRAAEQTSAQ